MRDLDPDARATRRMTKKARAGRRRRRQRAVRAHRIKREEAATANRAERLPEGLVVRKKRLKELRKLYKSIAGGAAPGRPGINDPERLARSNKSRGPSSP